MEQHFPRTCLNTRRYGLHSTNNKNIMFVSPMCLNHFFHLNRKVFSFINFFLKKKIFYFGTSFFPRKNMRVEVSDGEVVDKYSILCIKAERIVEEEKKKHVVYEKELLEPDALRLIEPWKEFYELLLQVNRQIWDKTDEIKQMEVGDARYAPLAHDIFILNDQRFRLKRVFQTGNVQEQKSYPDKVIRVNVGSCDDEEWKKLVMDYDLVLMDGCVVEPLPSCFRPSTT